MTYRQTFATSDSRTVTILPAKPFRYHLQTLAWNALILVEVLLATRLVLHALGTYAGVILPAFFNDLTAPFLAPFHAIFGASPFNEVPLDLSALFALCIYGVAIPLLIELFVLGKRMLDDEWENTYINPD